MGYLSSERQLGKARKHDLIGQPSTTAIVCGNHYLLFQPKGGWREGRPDKDIGLLWCSLSTQKNGIML